VITAEILVVDYCTDSRLNLQKIFKITSKWRHFQENIFLHLTSTGVIWRLGLIKISIAIFKLKLCIEIQNLVP